MSYLKKRNKEHRPHKVLSFFFGLAICLILPNLSIFATDRDDLGIVYFYTATKNELGEWDYSRSLTVSLRPSKSVYGYYLTFPSPDPVMVTDIIILPEAPEN